MTKVSTAAVEKIGKRSGVPPKEWKKLEEALAKLLDAMKEKPDKDPKPPGKEPPGKKPKPSPEFKKLLEELSRDAERIRNVLVRVKDKVAEKLRREVELFLKLLKLLLKRPPDQKPPPALIKAREALKRLADELEKQRPDRPPPGLEKLMAALKELLAKIQKKPKEPPGNRPPPAPVRTLLLLRKLAAKYKTLPVEIARELKLKPKDVQRLVQ